MGGDEHTADDDDDEHTTILTGTFSWALNGQQRKICYAMVTGPVGKVWNPETWDI